MKKSVLEKKWKAVNTGDTYADVYSSDGIEICTVWSGGGGLATAKQIASDHNKQLKVKKALAKTPFEL